MTTAQMKSRITGLMPRIAPKILSGMNPDQALEEAINEENALLAELAEGKTQRAKLANTHIMTTIYNKNN